MLHVPAGRRHWPLSLCVWSLVAACSSGGQIEDGPSESPFPVRTGAAGCAIEQLTSAPLEEFQFNGVSDDGRWLVYSWEDGEDAAGNRLRGAWRVDLETGDTIELPAVIANGGAFSPDGTLLVGAQPVDGGRTDIVEFRLADGTSSIIAADPGWDYLPSYSPDGRHILFNSDRGGDSMDLYLYERSSGSLRRLTALPDYAAHGQFSPDGRRVLFHRMVGRREGGGYIFDLYRLEVADGSQTRVTDRPFEESYPSWAPDSRTFVFSSDFEEAPEKHNLYVMDEGGELTKLTDGDWKDSYSYWTRDGRYIYFNSDRDGNTDVFRIPMNGTDCLRNN